MLKQWIRTHSDYTVRKVFNSNHPRVNTAPGSEMLVLKADHQKFADRQNTHQLLTDALMAYDV